MSLTSVTATILRQALEADEIVLGNLQPVRDYCFVDDVVSGIVRAATLPCLNAGTFNLGTGVGTSVGELARLASRLAGRQLPIRTDPSRRRPISIEINELVADTRHADQGLEWKPAVAIEEGLGRTLNWMLSHS
jgi:nucleoside-diphosphate-sugar epimerase